MPTVQQIKLIHIAAKSVKLDDAGYRMLLKNAAGVESSKDLDQAGFEDCMAVLEDLGFASPSPRHPLSPSPFTYWRNRVAQRGSTTGNRMLHKLRELSAGSRYPLDRMAERFSDGRTDDPAKLTPREAWKLIEMYKGSNQRNSPNKEVPHAAIEQPSLF